MNKDLRKLQLMQLEMLKFIDSVCKEHNICYSLYAGTLLGAVRHKGFIPWDDDLDICMSREDYNRFLNLWKKIDHTGYFLQNKENTPTFTQSFTKIRKDHTTFLQKSDPKNNYHSGIFIDIFPIDRMPNGTINRLFFIWNCMKYQLYTREFIPPKGNVIERFVSSVLLWWTPDKLRPMARKKLIKKITSYKSERYNRVAIEIISTIKTPLPVDLCDDYVLLQFEDGEFMCFKKWEEYLKIKFNNYMQFPPEKEQVWKHHPIVLNFEKNYDEIKKEKL